MIAVVRPFSITNVAPIQNAMLTTKACYPVLLVSEGTHIDQVMVRGDDGKHVWVDIDKCEIVDEVPLIEYRSCCR